MSKWRIITVLSLVAAPALFLMGYGSYHLWLGGLSFWAWWPMMASLALAYLLAWHWQRKQKLLRVDFEVPLHWTDRDKEAWKLVEQWAKAAEKLPADDMVRFTFYAEVAQEMALELARVYHPEAQDPLSSLTLPEVLAIIELASSDLSELVDKYLPGGHLMTIKDWKNARKAAEYYQTASTVYWAVSALFSPINTALRFMASQVGVSRPLALLQQNLLLWFYTAFLQRMGTYLIDLNSGRLRVGADRYRQLLDAAQKQAVARQESEPGSAKDWAPGQEIAQVSIMFLGQVNAGKSSLVNAILGEQRARTNVLAETREITRYVLAQSGIRSRLELLDSRGYGHAGPGPDQLTATIEAAKQSDLVLMVLHARTAARQPDLAMLHALRDWFLKRPELKMPRVIGVLTHIDLLAPAMEWQPPYNWREPQRVKEMQIAEATGAVLDLFGDHAAAVVPVCVAQGRIYGVEEWLVPTIVELLGEARAVALLRCLRAEVDSDKVRKVFRQLLAAGQELLTATWLAKKT